VSGITLDKILWIELAPPPTRSSYIAETRHTLQQLNFAEADLARINSQATTSGEGEWIMRALPGIDINHPKDPNHRSPLIGFTKGILK
jgi:hypothetical protein